MSLTKHCKEWPEPGIPPSIRRHAEPVEYDEFEPATRAWRHFVRDQWDTSRPDSTAQRRGSCRADYHFRAPQDELSFERLSTEPCLEGCSSSKIDKVCICLSAWTPERKALLAKYLILFTGWDSSGYGHLCSKFDALMSADGEETETDPKSESTTTTAERVEGYISRESVAEPNFLDMHMAQDGTVLFADLKTKFIIDDRALETDLVLWVEYENNGTPDVIYRVQFVDKYFGDYRVRVAMGDGVEATMGGEEIYGERKEDEIAVEMDPVDFTHPSLDLYVEFNKIGPDDQDNREWAAGIIELSASVYLDAERKGNGIAIGYDLRRVLIDGWKPLEIVER